MMMMGLSCGRDEGVPSRGRSRVSSPIAAAAAAVPSRGLPLSGALARQVLCHADEKLYHEHLPRHADEKHAAEVTTSRRACTNMSH